MKIRGPGVHFVHGKIVFVQWSYYTMIQHVFTSLVSRLVG